jgi:hypothetical protein
LSLEKGNFFCFGSKKLKTVQKSSIKLKKFELTNPCLVFLEKIYTPAEKRAFRKESFPKRELSEKRAFRKESFPKESFPKESSPKRELSEKRALRKESSPKRELSEKRALRKESAPKRERSEKRAFLIGKF